MPNTQYILSKKKADSQYNDIKIPRQRRKREEEIAMAKYAPGWRGVLRPRIRTRLLVLNRAGVRPGPGI